MPARIALDNQEIIRRYKAGESGDTIGKALGVSGRTILHRLRELGIPRRYKIKLDTASIVKQYESGKKVADIAKSLNVSENTILNRLNEGGVELRRGPRRMYNDVEICRMYQEGMSVSDIKAKTGAHNVATFYAILKRNGVPVRLQSHSRECPVMEKKITALRAQGLTLSAIARAVGINRNYVRHILKKEVAVDRKPWQPQVTVNRTMSVREMRDADLTINEIADITGMSPVDVFKELKP